MFRKLIFVVLLFCASPLFATALFAQTVHSNTLSWGASATTGATYNVFKSPTTCAAATSTSFVVANTAPISGLSYVDTTNLVDGGVNCYYVVALSGTSSSTQSNFVEATTPKTIAAPPVTAPPGMLKNSAQ